MRVALTSALRNRASPIRGTRLQRLLVMRVGDSHHFRGGAPACLSACVVAVWRSAHTALGACFAWCPEGRLGRPPRLRSPGAFTPGFCAYLTCVHCMFLLQCRQEAGGMNASFFSGTSLRAAAPHQTTLQIQRLFALQSLATIFRADAFSLYEVIFVHHRKPT